MLKVVSYYRTSTLTNVGENKDSFKRQDFKCKSFCNENKLSIVKSFYDKGVKGKDSISNRLGFSELLFLIA